MNDRTALGAYGWDDRVAGAFSALPDSTRPVGEERIPGRVVRVERIHALVRTRAGEIAAGMPPDEALPAVGDWVTVDVSTDDHALILTRLERRSVLTRRDPENRRLEQVLAANLDIVAIFAPIERLSLARVEREMLAAFESGAQPIVLLTKADLAQDTETLLAEAERRLASVQVILTSCKTGAGVDAVRDALRPNRTAVFLGPSGAGKSSLANEILGDDVLAVGEVRARDLRGRHTTTNRQLVPVPGGGILIDTPGIRSLGVWAGEEGLAAAFADIAALGEQCRFSDCRHDHEPDCAVLGAVDQGDLDAERLASSRKLSDEIDEEGAIQTKRRR
ncbi:MAG: ribosome small subunit-dependent GTPase A [Acidimicrobiales bacterium]